MNTEQMESEYKVAGLLVFRQSDKAGAVYEPHRHGAVRIYITKGSIKVRLDDGDWQVMKAGQELVITDGQLHEAVVSDEGWEYIFATTSEEAKHQKML